VTDHVVALSELPDEPVRVFLEVDPRYRRIRRKPWPIEHDELEALGERQLATPGALPADHTPVNEDDALHGGILRL
jgi:hypothetical protein